MNNAIAFAGVGMMIVGAIAFATWYAKNSREKREAKEAAARHQEELDTLRETGYGPGDRPMNGALEMDILESGPASNAQHVDADFRRVFWRWADHEGYARAFRRAMYARCWKNSSQGQVYDRLKSHGLIDESTKERWRDQARRDYPDGFGAAFSPGCAKPIREW